MRVCLGDLNLKLDHPQRGNYQRGWRDPEKPGRNESKSIISFRTA